MLINMTKRQEELSNFHRKARNQTTLAENRERWNVTEKTISMLRRVAKDGGLVVVTERGSTGTYVMNIDFVGPRWFKGSIRCCSSTDETTIAYTAMYSDLLTSAVRVEEVPA